LGFLDLDLGFWGGCERGFCGRDGGSLAMIRCSFVDLSNARNWALWLRVEPRV